jgi:hypothetical protein
VDVPAAKRRQLDIGGLSGDDPVSLAVYEFGRTVATQMGRGGDDEAQLRGPLETLLRRLGRHLGLTAVPYGEVQLKDLRARPDYAVDVGNSRVGYIELKATRRGVPFGPGWRPRRTEREQWGKLSTLPNVIYSDGQTWCRYSYGVPVSPVVLLAGSIADPYEPLRPQDASFIALIHDFLLWEPEQPRSLADLIKVVAGLCDLLHDEVYFILTGAARFAAQEDLTLLADDWRDLLFPGLDNDGFADAFAQTITFAMLLARAEGIGFDTSIHEIARRLGKKHLLIGRAFAVLTGGPAADELRTIETLRRVIAVVEWQTLQDSTVDSYSQLYERFLAIYDPMLRKTTGSYYTPAKLARFMVEFADRVLRTRLELSWGLADDVVVVDPAMGTGTFLFEVVRAVSQTVESNLGRGAVPGHVRELIRERLIGFEIQVAPYAVAELRLHQALRSQFEVEVPPEDLRFLTDALANPRVRQERLGAPYRPIESARERANRIKREVPVMVVIGNPPHVQNAKGRAPWIEERRKDAPSVGVAVERPSLDEFRADVVGHGRYESDLHGMPWYFWRWACWKVFEAHPRAPTGIVGFITPSSFLKGKAFAGIRSYLRHQCDEGWIIDLSPEGTRPPAATRIFGGEVGRELCIALFVRRDGGDRSKPARIRYLSIEGTKVEKLERLETIAPDDAGWADCGEHWHGTFLQASHANWDQFPSLGDLMPWRSRGVTPGRTWVYAPTADILRRRWDELIASGDLVRRALFPGQSRDRSLDSRVDPLPGFDDPGRPLSREHRDCPSPIPAAYRSFDRQWVIPDNRLMVMARPPLWDVLSDKQIYVSEQDVHEVGRGPGLVFTALIPDLDHFSGWGGGGVRPVWRDRNCSRANVAPGLLKMLSDRLGVDVPMADLIAYIAAIVAHPGFTTRFDAELKQPGIRVPLTALPSAWSEAISIGREVIWLHTYAARCAHPGAGRPSGERALIEKYGVRCSRPVAGVPDRISEVLEYDSVSRELQFGGGSFGPVRHDVVDYAIGNRRVVWRWLNDRTLRPRNKRRSSRLDDIGVTEWTRRLTEELLALLSVVTGCVELHETQAGLLGRICDGPLISNSDLVDASVLPVDRSASLPPRTRLVGATPLLEDLEP